MICPRNRALLWPRLVHLLLLKPNSPSRWDVNKKPCRELARVLGSLKSVPSPPCEQENVKLGLFEAPNIPRGHVAG
jgi:hypothetical protein